MDDERSSGNTERPGFFCRHLGAALRKAGGSLGWSLAIGLLAVVALTSCGSVCFFCQPECDDCPAGYTCPPDISECTQQTCNEAADCSTDGVDMTCVAGLCVPVADIALCNADGLPECSEDLLTCADEGEVCGAVIVQDTAGNEVAQCACIPSICGNGVLDEGEECDDGNILDGDGCSSTCRIQTACGDSPFPECGGSCPPDFACFTSPSGGGCECILPFCGNGVVEPGEECDDGAESFACDIDCTVPACGDGWLNETAGEECDDGNNLDGDGCSGDCRVECSASDVAVQCGGVCQGGFTCMPSADSMFCECM